MARIKTFLCKSETFTHIATIAFVSSKISSWQVTSGSGSEDAFTGINLRTEKDRNDRLLQLCFSSVIFYQSILAFTIYLPFNISCIAVWTEYGHFV